MDHKQFHEAVQALAGERYCTTTVEAITTTEYDTKTYKCDRKITRVRYRAYIDTIGWSLEAATPELAVAGLIAKTSLTSIGEAPEATPVAQPEPEEQPTGAVAA